jgi:multicomponent Na+:H+ antiporter subunit G
MFAKAVEYFLVIAGAFFLFVSGVGLWRLGDFFERIHAPTKACTLGLVSLFGATVIALGGTTATKAFLAVVFIAASAPVGSHYLSRTAHRCGLRPRGEKIRDDYATYREREGGGA